MASFKKCAEWHGRSLTERYSIPIRINHVYQRVERRINSPQWLRMNVSIQDCLYGGLKCRLVAL